MATTTWWAGAVSTPCMAAADDDWLGGFLMFGGADDDTYFVTLATQIVTESTNEGVDLVFASIDYALGANVENLYSQPPCREWHRQCAR